MSTGGAPQAAGAVAGLRPGLAVRGAVRAGTEHLAAAAIEGPRLDAELLLGHVVGLDRTRLVVEGRRLLDGAELEAFAWLLDRRARMRQPVAHLVGRRGFRRLELRSDRRALVPRPETELLVEVGLALPPGARVLDVGTGTGAVALALADERPDLEVHGSDVDPDALALAAENADVLGLDVALHRADLLDGLAELHPDAILANPPYVAETDRGALAPEVHHDPPLALFGGPDGLDVLRRLWPAAAATGAALVAVEHGAGQGRDVAALAREAGFARTEQRHDLAGHDRVVVARR